MIRRYIKKGIFLSKAWYVYIIESSDQRLYTGITIDMARRWTEHLGLVSTKVFKGAKFFRGRKPANLVYLSQFDNRSLASKQESAIKKLTREQKLRLIGSSENRIEELSISLALGNFD